MFKKANLYYCQFSENHCENSILLYKCISAPRTTNKQASYFLRLANIFIENVQFFTISKIGSTSPIVSFLKVDMEIVLKHMGVYPK